MASQANAVLRSSSSRTPRLRTNLRTIKLYLDNISGRNHTSADFVVKSGNIVIDRFKVAVCNEELYVIENKFGIKGASKIEDGTNYGVITFKLGKLRGGLFDVEFLHDRRYSVTETQKMPISDKDYSDILKQIGLQSWDIPEGQTTILRAENGSMYGITKHGFRYIIDNGNKRISIIDPWMPFVCEHNGIVFSVDSQGRLFTNSQHKIEILPTSLDHVDHADQSEKAA